MTTTVNPIVAAWEAFQSDTRDTLLLRPPESEAEYDALVQFADELTDTYNCNEGPQAALFDLVAAYIDHWERQHYADLKDVQVPPHKMLAHYMDQHGVSQYQLDKEGVASQQNLSKILKGERGISLELAKRLAERFNVGVEMFV